VPNVKLDLSSFDLDIELEDNEQIVDVIVVVRKVTLDCSCDSVTWTATRSSAFMMLGMIETVKKLMMHPIRPNNHED